MELFPLSSGNLMRKSRAERKKSLTRREGRLEPYPTVLVVCEGHTETQYLKGIRDRYKLSTANVEIVPGENSSPDQVLKHALRVYDEYLSNKQLTNIEHLFCVIDRDHHAHYLNVLDTVNNKKLKMKHKIKAINSVPCFEVWVWMHKVDSSKCFYRGGRLSPCDEVIKEVTTLYPDYDKTSFDILEATGADQEHAETAARRLRRQHDGRDARTYTRMDELIEFLKELKNKKAVK